MGCAGSKPVDEDALVGAAPAPELCDLDRAGDRAARTHKIPAAASASFCCPWKRGKTPVRQVTAQDTERAERETLKWRDGLEEAAVIDPVFDEGNPVRRTRRAACCSRSASSVDCLKCPTTRCLPAR
jgi:hypothetical protein